MSYYQKTRDELGDFPYNIVNKNLVFSAKFITTSSEGSELSF